VLSRVLPEPLENAGTRLVKTMSVDHFSGDRYMTPVKPLMMALSCGVALWGARHRHVESKWLYRAFVGTASVLLGTTVYGGYEGRQAQKQFAERPSAHEEAATQAASPGVEGHIVSHRELRLLNPDTRTFERFVMPEGVEEFAE
jgi:hypothetical protein